MSFDQQMDVAYDRWQKEYNFALAAQEYVIKAECEKQTTENESDDSQLAQEQSEQSSVSDSSIFSSLIWALLIIFGGGMLLAASCASLIQK